MFARKDSFLMTNEKRNPSEQRPDYGKDNPGQSAEHRRDAENRHKGKERTPETSHSILRV